MARYTSDLGVKKKPLNDLKKIERILLLLLLVFNFSHRGRCQSNDTLVGRIIWVKNLKECLLIGVVSSSDVTDTSVVISDLTSGFNVEKKRKMRIGQTYKLAVEDKIITTKLTGKFSVQFKNTIVWTNKEPYNLKPRLCLNCIGQYIKIER